jgi:serine/threonine-protein kinase
MAEIEHWSISPAKPPLNKHLERPGDAADGKTTPGPSRRWLRYSAIAVAILSVIAASGFAYYQYIWSVPVDVPAPPVPPLNPSASPSPVPTDEPTTPPVDSPARGDMVRRFLQQYDGGDCFFIMPVAIGTSAAAVEGFGASTAPFEALDRSFKKAQGFEAQIGVRMVTAPQCPAITFLNKVRGDHARAPRISLGSVKIRTNETVTGNIENFANRVVELLLITEDGQVQNISYLLRPGTDALSFSIEMKRAEDSLEPNVPQLIMAVATPQVLDSLRQPRPTPADQFFLQVLSEAQRRNMTINAAARYVTIQK